MPGLDQYAMLDLIAEAARSVSPETPELLSMRQLNALSRTDARFSALPRAQHLSRIFMQGWRDLVALSLMSEPTRSRTLAIRVNVEEAGWFTHEQAEFALRLVCRRLGGLATFTPSDYRRERDDMSRGSARRAGAHTVERTLPTEHQVIAIFGDWDEALVAVGLLPRENGGASGTNRAGTTNGNGAHGDVSEGASGEGAGPDGGGVRGGRYVPLVVPTIIDVLDRCYEHYGVQPTTRELEVFAKANGIPFPRRERGRSWDEYLEEWKEGRRDEGLVAPERPPAKRDRPDYAQDVGAARDGERRMNRDWNEETIVPWVVRFLDELPRNGRPTERTYMDWVVRTPGAPAQSTLQHHGGFAQFVAEARLEILGEYPSRCDCGDPEKQSL